MKDGFSKAKTLLHYWTSEIFVALLNLKALEERQWKTAFALIELHDGFEGRNRIVIIHGYLHSTGNELICND